MDAMRIEMPERTPTVVVIGSTYIDMAVKCDQIPSGGQSVAGSAFSVTATGPGPNEAVQAALCGCDVYLVSKIGSDPFAQTVKTSLADYKVNTDFLYTAEAKNTGAIITLVNGEGENAVCTCTGANNALVTQDIEFAEKIIAEADVCLIHGQLPKDAIVAAIRCAKLHGTKVILNPAQPITQNERENHPLPDEYFNADILMLNLYEAAELIDASSPIPTRREAAKLIGSDLVARGAGAAILTMGMRGCMVVDRDGVDHIPAFVVELVDHTCTGDAFAGALAAYCTIKNNTREAVKFASAAGALACTKFGTLEALPTRAEIIELLQKE